MSLTRKVAITIEERGSATIEELLSAHHGYSRKQVNRALDNAKVNGWIATADRRPGRPPPDLQLRYYPGAGVPEIEEAPRSPFRPPASVWELARGSKIPGLWPPVAKGRAYMLLSAGDVASEEAAA